MENVGSGRVVDDDDLLQVPAQFVEVLDVVAAIEDAALAEQSRPEDAPLVQQVGHGIRVFGEGGGEQHALVQFAHPFQEVVDVRSLQHVHLMHRSVDLDWDDKVRVADRLQNEGR